MKIGMVLLAAGQSKRFGQSKLETLLNGKPIIEYILSNIPVDTFDKVVIVAANKNILSIAQQYSINGIINDCPELGLARSVAMGTKEVKDTDAYMYCVSDQPMLRKTTIENMVNAYKENTILALAHNGRRGNPVIFPNYLFDELVSLEIGQTGQKVINNHLDILEHYNTDDKTQLLDVDTGDNFDEIRNIIGEKGI